MFDIIKFIIKAAIVLVLIYLVTRLDYNGRKIGTYIVEAFNSYKVHETVDSVKTTVGVSGSKHAKINKTFGNSKPMSDITDKERKELENIMEQ